MEKYHYEYFAYTDNLCYGRLLIGQGRTRTEAAMKAQWSGKGCYAIEMHRVYNQIKA